MKRQVAIRAGIALALVVSTLVISLLCLRGPGVSMTLLEYRRWPQGVMLRLKNDTQTTIRYLAERDATPMGSPILCAKKTSNGWSNTGATVSTVWLVDPVTKKMDQGLFLTRGPPKAGDHFESLQVRDLRPGQSVDFFVWVEPGASPERIGTICLVPQSEFARKLQPWLLRIKKWCRMQMRLPGQVEVWCPDSLYIPPLGESSRGN